MKNIKKLLALCFSIVAIKGIAFENDSLKNKKSFHSVEFFIGMSPKIKKKENFEVPKSYATVGVRHQYNMSVTSSIYINTSNELLHGEELVRENFKSQSGIPLYRQINIKYLNVYTGVGVLKVFKIRKQSDNMFFINGGLLFGYKYNYKKITKNSYIDENTGEILEAKYIRKYDFFEERINFGINTSFPFYIKFGINKNHIALSLTQYLFTQKYDFEFNRYNRFFTTLNISLVI